MLSTLVYLLFRLITLLIVITVLLSWIPNIDWYKQPFVFLRQVSELFLSPFRKIIPPISGLDISPILALVFLQFVGAAIARFLASMGL